MARLLTLLVICALPFAALANFRKMVSFNSPQKQIDKTQICNRNLIKSLGMDGKDNPDNERLEMCPDVPLTCCLKTDQIAIYENQISRQERSDFETKLLFAQKIYTDFMDASEVVQKLAKDLLAKYRYKRISNCQVLAKRIAEFNTTEVFPRLKVAISEMLNFFKTTYSGVYCAACDARLQKYFSLRNEYNMTISFSKVFCREMLSKVLHPTLYLEKYFAIYAELLTKFGTLCNKRNKFFDDELDDADVMIPKATRVQILEHCLANVNHEGRWFTFCKPICNRFNMLKFNRYFLPNLNEIKRITLLLQEVPDKFKKVGGPKVKAPSATDGGATPEAQKLEIDSRGKKGEDETFFEFRKRLFEMRETEIDKIEERFKNDIVINAPTDAGFVWDKANPAFVDRGGINLYKIGQRANFNMATYLKILFSKENIENNKSQFWEPPNNKEDMDTQFMKAQAQLQSLNSFQQKKKKNDTNSQNSTKPSGDAQTQTRTGAQAQPGKEASRRLRDFVSSSQLANANIIALLLMLLGLRAFI